MCVCVCSLPRQVLFLEETLVLCVCVCMQPAETGAVLGGDADVVCVCVACRDRCCSWRRR